MEEVQEGKGGVGGEGGGGEGGEERKGKEEQDEKVEGVLQCHEGERSTLPIVCMYVYLPSLSNSRSMTPCRRM